MSETRIGVPFRVATTMSLKSVGGVDAAERAQQQLALLLLDRAAGDLDVLGDEASRTCASDSPYEFSFSMSTTMWISRARPPARLTSPTPLTVWITRAICLSVSSVSVRRLIALDDTISDITGSASGSTLVMTGGSSSGGSLRIALATFSRTSFDASLMSRSRTKRTVI